MFSHDNKDMILADFHIHSCFSDGKHSVAEIVDFYGKRGFGAIAITDHLCETNTFLGKAAVYLGNTLTQESFPLYLKTLQEEKLRAWDQYKMTLIPGVEITKNSFHNHRSAHILALNLTHWIEAQDPIETILKNIRDQGALSIAAHPVFTRKAEKQHLHLWGRRGELAPLIDAWEVASGPYLFEEVLNSGLPMIANSDLHRFSQINSWKSVFDCSNDAPSLMDAIRKQNLKLHFYLEKVERISRLKDDWERIIYDPYLSDRRRIRCP